jgi:ribosome maturation factor RimP
MWRNCLVANAVKIQELIEPSVVALGYSLWGLEFISAGKHSVLRVYIDKEDGILVDDCAAVSHHISGVLDVEDPISTEYTLEVSSPGMDRPLFKLDQYKKYIDNWVEIKLRSPFEGRRKFAGTLTAVEGEDVVVRIDNEEFILPVDAIDKANIVSKD